MIDIASLAGYVALQSILNTIVGVPVRKPEVIRLPGDASNRTYYRVLWEGVHSLILMVLAEPEEFKGSEEAVSGTPSPITELPFINIHRHLESCHVRVPKIFHYDPQKGWLLIEDLGDAMLADVVAKYPIDSQLLLNLYQKAIDTLIQIQRFATPTPNIRTLAHSRSFDQALFIWEFDHFIEYGIEKGADGLAISKKDKDLMRGIFSDIALRLAMLPQVFTHRDYHSRNLMIKEENICTIDFQDALMGPREYDLASLLRDSYIDLPEPVIDRLILYYIERWEEASGEAVHKEQFREFFDLISIQRNLKAAGRFVYIDQVKNNPKFLPYVPTTLAKVKRNLEKHKRLKPLHELLSKYVKALQ